MTNLSLAAPLLVLLIGLAIWLGSACLCYLNWRRSPNPSVSAKLESLRLILITLLVFTLLRPEYIKRIERKDAPEIVILTDASDSMKTRDIVATNKVESRADWLQQQRARQFWKPLETKANVSVEDCSASSTNTTGA